MYHQKKYITISQYNLKRGFARLFLMVIMLFSVFASGFLHAANNQDSTSILEKRLEGLSGKDKLVVLNQITALYLDDNNTKKALRYAKRARELADAIIHKDNALISEADLYLKPLTYLWLGLAHKQRGQYMESKEAFQVSLSDAERLNLPELAHRARWNMEDINAAIDSTGKDKKNLLGNTFKNIGSGVNKTTAEFSLNATLKLAAIHEQNGNYIKAIDYYTKAMEQLKDQGDYEQVYKIKEHIGDLLGQDGQYTKALDIYEDVGSQVEQVEDSAGAARINEKTGVIRERIGESLNNTDEQENRQLAEDAPVVPKNQLKLSRAEGNADSIRLMAEKAEETQDYQASLYYFKEYLAIEQQLAEERTTQELVLLEKVNELENREREITLLKQQEEINALQIKQNNAELDRQIIYKRNLAIGLALLAFLVFTLYLLYRNKRRDLNKLGVAYNDLEATKNDLKNAQQHIKALLHQQVSGAIADELLSTKDVHKVEKRFVCIMFLDIRDFTPFVENLSPEDIIEYQNQVFGFMIETVNRRQGIVNQILGDGFMATFGAPVATDNDCQQAYLAAKEIIAELHGKSKWKEIPPTKIGIGLHAGYVVTGNVGTKNRMQYSITGNTVILASRLEQLNKEFGSTLVMSKEVYTQLPEEMRIPIEFRKVEVKGRSEPMEIAFF